MLLLILAPAVTLGDPHPAVVQVLRGAARGDANAAGQLFLPTAALLPGAASGAANAPGALLTASAVLLPGKATVQRDRARPRSPATPAIPR